MFPEYVEAFSSNHGFWTFFQKATDSSKKAAPVQVAPVNTEELNKDTLVQATVLRGNRPRLLTRRAARDARRAAH